MERARYTGDTVRPKSIIGKPSNPTRPLAANANDQKSSRPRPAGIRLSIHVPKTMQPLYPSLTLVVPTTLPFMHQRGRHTPTRIADEHTHTTTTTIHSEAIQRRNESAATAHRKQKFRRLIYAIYGIQMIPYVPSLPDMPTQKRPRPEYDLTFSILKHVSASINCWLFVGLGSCSSIINTVVCSRRRCRLRRIKLSLPSNEYGPPAV